MVGVVMVVLVWMVIVGGDGGGVGGRCVVMVVLVWMVMVMVGGWG